MCVRACIIACECVRARVRVCVCVRAHTYCQQREGVYSVEQTAKYFFDRFDTRFGVRAT